jgi:hypothetical protein
MSVDDGTDNERNESQAEQRQQIGKAAELSERGQWLPYVLAFHFLRLLEVCSS